MGRSSRSEGYVLRGGRAGAERLRLLNRVKWPTTEALLGAAGLRAGMSCLDMGYGSGDVTLKVAALVGAEGHVVGVDRDQSTCGWRVRRPANKACRSYVYLTDGIGPPAENTGKSSFACHRMRAEALGRYTTSWRVGLPVEVVGLIR